MVYAEPTLVDLALAAAGATRAQMSGVDHLAEWCFRDHCDIAPVTAADASAGCDGAADRTACAFSNALEAYAKQLFPQETAGTRVAAHLSDFNRQACSGVDPILCEVTRRDCAIVPSWLGLYDTVARYVVVDLVMSPGGEDFLRHVEITHLPDRDVPRSVYLECAAAAARERR